MVPFPFACCLCALSAVYQLLLTSSSHHLEFKLSRFSIHPSAPFLLISALLRALSGAMNVSKSETVMRLALEINGSNL